MSEIAVAQDRPVDVDELTQRLYCASRRSMMEWTDRLFIPLMLFQWVACILAAIWISPLTWKGTRSELHPHVLVALCFGGVLCSLPVFLSIRYPGRLVTRHVIAVSQMLFGSLLIDLTGGRIETHFHVFGSLAFLAFYRDWRVLLTGTAIVTLDHVIRGIWWPMSVYGEVGSSLMRSVEHAGWVVFMDIFLIAAAIRNSRDLQIGARRQAEKDAIYAAIDATVIERTRELAAAKALADSACNTKSEFLANMSHEIRTPLTAILGYCELLRDEAIAERAPQRSFQTIDTIRRAGEHLLVVINDILDLSKIEAGKLLTERIEMHLPSVLVEVDSLMRPRLSGKQIQLRVLLQTAIPDRIISDPTRLRQILLNLLGNAVKFTKAGFVEARVRVLEVDGKPRLKIEVEDSGEGMTADQAASLFTPFVQGDASVTRSHGGTGLGLTISRRLARLMGGEVSLDYSQPGQGTRFVLELPLLKAPSSALVHDLVACSLERHLTTDETTIELSGRILLAEDSEDNQFLITHRLKKSGAEVDIAANGRIALEKLAAASIAGKQYDLLLTDMQMPEIDGYTLAKTLRARGYRIPIVALTANAMAEDAQKCLTAGCDAYISKPINKVALLSTCQQWISNGRGAVTEPPIDLLAEVSHPQNDRSETLVSELADDPQMVSLISSFLSKLEPKMNQMSTYLMENRLDELAKLAHQLTGAGGGYGFPTISDAARRVENVAMTETALDEIQTAVADLSRICRQAVAGGTNKDSMTSTLSPTS